MATKPDPSAVVVNVEESLDVIDKTMERVKSLYEQYFLGIQKQPPTFIHNDLERKLRDLQQVQIRNTALRYRYATLQQKFGSYNSYWRRTLRQIENGTYVRQLAKVGRKAAEHGEDIPEEILAKMPKRMREQVRRDREAAMALAARRKQLEGDAAYPPDDGSDFYEEFAKPAAAPKTDARGAHLLDEDDADLDLDKFFAAVEAEEDNEATQSGPPPQPFAPTPSAPASQRAAVLGGLPRAQSPAIGAAPAIPPTKSQPGVQPLGSAFKTQSMPPVMPPNRASQPVVPPIPTQPTPQPMKTMAMPAVPAPGQRPSQPVIPAIPAPGQRQSQPVIPNIPTRASQPAMPPASTPQLPTEPIRTQPLPALQRPPAAPSQVVRPNPIAPGSSQHKQVEVESMNGPFAREPSVSVPRRQKRDTDLDGGVEVPQAPTPPPQQPMRATPTPQPMRPASTPQRPAQPMRPPVTKPAGAKAPPGMTDADVDSLYQKYVKAKQMVGEQTNAQTYGKLLNTINAQAPKIMEQYKAKGVDFSVVVKDNQVIIKAKPKP